MMYLNFIYLMYDLLILARLGFVAAQAFSSYGERGLFLLCIGFL